MSREEAAHILRPISSTPAAPTSEGSGSNAVSTISGSPSASDPYDCSTERSPSFDTTSDTKNLVSVEQRRLQQQSHRSTTSFHIGLNYVNSILGSGIVGIPYALKQAGFGLGLFLLIAIALVTDYSLSLLVKSANLAGVTSYQDLVHVCFGGPGWFVVSMLQLIYPLIAMWSYNVIIADTVSKILPLASRNTIVFLSTVFITLPLSLQKNIARMSKISMISLFLIIYISGFVIVRFPYYSDLVGTSDDHYTILGDGIGTIVQAIAIICFSFQCHHSSFLLYGALEEPTQLRWDNVTHLAIGISLLVSFVFGISGYASFKALSEADLFENYCLSDRGANIARLLFAVTVALTYPVECFVVRDVIEKLLWASKDLLSDSHHLMITILIVISTYLLSTLTDCLGVVLELNGLMTGLPLAFILPSICYIKLESGSIFSKRKIYALLLAIFGVTIATIGALKVLSQTFLSGSSATDTCSHGLELDYCRTFNHSRKLEFPVSTNETMKHWSTNSTNNVPMG
ncbi:putative sodium-coupled neutral amino acid transporter 11 [Fragariocoptes setiger]|uniref:Putative sodium-coupled neutral amino acid transporter 11 n=1 Tax=Fragariocoptes setiger TaxID=1670756 RepID=A0ABQ7S866_9ACAR|nr:putative sodium-coupled neutral amino acid transporter 11 [Fragariocoptes setiger]